VQKVEAIRTAAATPRAVRTAHHSPLRQYRPSALQVGRKRWREASSDQRRVVLGRLRRWDILGTIQWAAPRVEGGKIAVADWSVAERGVWALRREIGGAARLVVFAARLLVNLLMMMWLALGLRTPYHLRHVIGLGCTDVAAHGHAKYIHNPQLRKETFNN